MRFTATRSNRLLTLFAGLFAASLVFAGMSGAQASTTAESVRIGNTALTIAHHLERVHLIRVDLADKHVGLAAASPGGGIGATRQTVLTMARAGGAIAGINANFFDPTSKGAEPVGGLVSNGSILKSPKPLRAANFYVTPDGRAHIGAMAFTGSITRQATLATPAVSRSLYSVNTIEDAEAGHITFVDHALFDVTLPPDCSVVTGRFTGSESGFIVSIHSGIRALPRRDKQVFSMITCGQNASSSWLLTQFQVGDSVSLTAGFASGAPRTLVSGGRQLVNDGRPYTDVSGPSPSGLNPLTFGCVSANGLHVLLGVLDGRWSQSRGLTYAQLTQYLITTQHCYDGLVFDGGGSSTMVARLKGHSSLSVINRPSDGVQRRVATALLVVRH